MSTGKTEHFDLHAWEGSDDFLREEFNENFDKIDKTLFQRARIAAGVYTGNGSWSQKISLGFTPQAVLITPESSSTWSVSSAGLAIKNFPAHSESGNYTAEIITIVEGGFKVYCGSNGTANMLTNDKSRRYHYLALG